MLRFCIAVIPIGNCKLTGSATQSFLVDGLPNFTTSSPLNPLHQQKQYKASYLQTEKVQMEIENTQ